MTIRIEAIEVLAERWADNTERAATESLLRHGSHQELSWGIACVRDGAYTLTRRAGCALSLTLPAALCERLGWERGDRVVYEVTEHGSIEVRRVTLEDLAPIARAAAQRADLLRDQSQPRRALKHFEKDCERCGKLYCAQRSNCRFCPHCGELRARESKRACWHRRGKLTPSYQARLGRRTLLPTGAKS